MRTTDSRGLIIMALIILISVTSLSLSARAQSPREAFGRAEELYWSNRYDSAARLYETVIDSSPSPELLNDARFGLARTLSDSGRPDRAAELFSMVSKGHPDSAVRGDALFSGIELALLRDRREKAEKLLQKFRENHSDHVLFSVARDEFSQLFQSEAESGGDTSQVSPSETDTTSEPAEQASDTSEPAEQSTGSTVTSGERETSQVDRTAAPEELPVDSSRNEPEAESGDTEPASPAKPPVQPPTEQIPSMQEVSSPAREIDTTPEKSSGTTPGAARRKAGSALDPVEALARDPALRKQLVAELERLKQRNSELNKQLERVRAEREDLSQKLDRRPPPAEVRKRLSKRYRDELESFSEDYRNLREKLKKARGDNDRLNSRISELQQEVAELEQSNDLLSSRNKRLRERLSTEVVNAIREGRLHELPEEVELSDTALQSLRERSSELVEQARKALENENYDAAINNLQPLLEDDPDSTVYFLAAEAYWGLSGEAEPAVNYLHKGLSTTDKPPLKKMLLMVQILVENGRRSELESFLSAHRNYIESRVGGNQKSRWHYLLGRRLVTKGSPDRAFFEFMNAVDAAPESRWADRSRQLIETGL